MSAVFKEEQGGQGLSKGREGAGEELRSDRKRGPGVPGSLSQIGFLRKQTLRQICGQKFYWEGRSGSTPVGGSSGGEETGQNRTGGEQ